MKELYQRDHFLKKQEKKNLYFLKQVSHYNTSFLRQLVFQNAERINGVHTFSNPKAFVIEPSVLGLTIIRCKCVAYRDLNTDIVYEGFG
jgi:hypothetical protein